MQKKGDFHIDTARKQFLQAGIVIILVVVLVGVLLYVEPGQRTGKAAEIVYEPPETGPIPLPDCTASSVLVRTPYSDSTSTSTSTLCCSSESFCADRDPSSLIGGCYTPESIYNNYYCAINFQEYVPSAASGHGWVRCDASMKDKTTEDDTFICDGTSWVQCNEDTDLTVAYDDKTIACNVDTGRWEESKGVSCGVGKEWVWSYDPDDNRDNPPALRRIGCCESNQCKSTNLGCIDFETGPSNNPGFICGNVNDWDVCGAVTDDDANKHPGDLSDGGGYTCIQNAAGSYLWRQTCNAENQFRMDNDEVCYNNQWRSCQNIPPLTEVDISCTDAGAMSVEERSCNDGIDNDHNGLFDCADAGCNSNIQIAVSPNDDYQVTVRSDACAGQSYNIN